MKTKRFMILGWILFICLTLSGILVNLLHYTSAGAQSEGYEQLKLFTEVLSIVKTQYVEDVNSKDLIYGALKGMLKTLDPHSEFLPPEAYKEMQIDTKGEFAGLGIQIGVKDGILTVIAPIEDTPAWRAGIKAGDKIIRIENEPTTDMILSDAVNKMRGPKGTNVTITIMREGWKELKDFTITRDIIKVKSVKYSIIDNVIGYVKVLQFQGNTSSEIGKSLKILKEKGINSLVLDLRNNPGGLLESAVDVAEQFLPPSKLVVYIQGKSGEKKEYVTSGKGVHYYWPIVVLVNHGSASASEIVAGALKDWDRAVLLGTKTFGKGSVQSVLPLSDGSGLRITTAKYYTPKGISIQNTGIEPDIEVKIEAKEGDAHAVVREKDLKNHLKNEQLPEDKERERELTPIKIDEEDDIQLQRAIDLLKGLNIFKEKV